MRPAVDFKLLFQAVPGSYLVLSPELTILAASKSYLRATYTNLKDIAGKHIFEVFPDNPAAPEQNSTQNLRQSIQEALHSKKVSRMPVIRYDIQLPESAGNFVERYWSPCNTPVLDEEGEVAYIIHEARDVTEQVLTERENQKNHHNLMLLSKAVGGITWESNLVTRKLTWSEEYKALFGYSDEDLEIDTSTWAQLIHPDDLESVQADIAKVIAAKGKLWTGEYRYRKANGTYTTVLDYGYILYDATGSPERILGSLIDIQLQKEHEQKLEESNKRFERIARATNDVIWDWNLQDDSIWWNEGFKTLFGYQEEDIEPTIISWTSRIHPEDLAAVKSSIYAVMNSGQPRWEAEYRFRCADGSYKLIFDRGYTLHNQEGKAIRMIGAMLDVTERKRIEQQLLESNDRFERFTQATNDVIWDWTISNGAHWVSAGFKKLFGYQDADITPTLDTCTSRIHPDDLDRVFASIQKVLDTSGKVWEEEYRFKCADGRYKIIHDKGYVIQGEDGKPVRMVGAMRDITEKKQFELQLQENIAHTHKVLESLPLMIWTATPDGLIDYYSQRWYDYTGTTFQELKEWGWSNVIHPDDLERTKTLWLHSVKTGETLTVENRWKSAADGLYRWFLARAVPIRDSQGNISRWVGSHTEIEEHKQMMLALEESTRKFQFLAESIPQMVWTTEPDGYHDYFNQRWLDYTGLTMEESMGLVWNDVLHPDDRQRAWERWQYSLRTGEYYEIEYRFKNGRTGVYRWFLGQAVPMRDQNGNIIKWFGTCTDIEDHKRAEEELVEKNLELERINYDLDSFVYTASHDLKLPVINMGGLFNELTRSAHFSDPDAPRIIEMFNRSLRQLNDTIHDLSEVVKVQKTKERELEEIDLQQAANDVMLGLQDLLQDAGATVDTDFTQAPSVFLTRASLKSILYNLLSNAIKYRAHDRSPEIRLSSKNVGNFVELKVEDNGLGIDMNKHQNKLFQMFKRFHNHVSGSGLGLYIVNRLLTNHEGYINIESTLNEGTTFYLYFKQKKA